MTSVGLAAGVGADLPPAARAWLKAALVDVGGLVAFPDRRTPRAWQVLGEDERRHEVRGDQWGGV